MSRYIEREVEVECEKCKTKGKAKANNFFDSIYICKNCGNIITVKKIKE